MSDEQPEASAASDPPEGMFLLDPSEDCDEVAAEDEGLTHTGKPELTRPETILEGDNESGSDAGTDPDGLSLAGIYHEKQVGALCAVHCVNNLLQGPFFDESAFREVASELDDLERNITGGEGVSQGEEGGNALEDGFFNVQVVQTVLARSGYNMLPLGSEEGWSAQADTAKETAFILNRRRHWFTVRKIGDRWFDLNSCLRQPRYYSDSDLRMQMHGAVEAGYGIFVVRGNFPGSGEAPAEAKHERVAVEDHDFGSQCSLEEGDAFAVVLATEWFGAPRCQSEGGSTTSSQFRSGAVGTTHGTLPVSSMVMRSSTTSFKRKRTWRRFRCCRGSRWCCRDRDDEDRNPCPLFTYSHVLLPLALWLISIWKMEEEPLWHREGGLEWLLVARTLHRTILVLHDDCLDHRWELWRWLTYQYTYSDGFQVGTTILVMFAAASSLEDHFGTLTTLICFNCGVVGGACAHVLLDVHNRLLGMSAGCECLLGMHFVLLLLTWHKVSLRFVKMLAVLVLSALDVLRVLLMYPGEPWSATKLSLTALVALYASHLGGYATGILVGLQLSPQGCRKNCLPLLVGSAWLGFSLWWAQQWPPRTLLQRSPWCWTREVNSTAYFGDGSPRCVRCLNETCASRWSDGFLAEANLYACESMREWWVDAGM